MLSDTKNIYVKKITKCPPTPQLQGPWTEVYVTLRNNQTLFLLKIQSTFLPYFDITKVQQPVI